MINPITRRRLDSFDARDARRSEVFYRAIGGRMRGGRDTRHHATWKRAFIRQAYKRAVYGRHG